MADWNLGGLRRFIGLRIFMLGVFDAYHPSQCGPGPEAEIWWSDCDVSDAALLDKFTYGVLMHQSIRTMIRRPSRPFRLIIQARLPCRDAPQHIMWTIVCSNLEPQT